MTYSLEIEVEELRAELGNAREAAERRQIESELAAAKAKLAAAVAALDANGEPPS